MQVITSFYIQCSMFRILYSDSRREAWLFPNALPVPGFSLCAKWASYWKSCKNLPAPVSSMSWSFRSAARKLRETQSAGGRPFRFIFPMASSSIDCLIRRRSSRLPAMFNWVFSSFYGASRRPMIRSTCRFTLWISNIL